jgi:ABC-2 type transport system permease protein
MSGGFKALVYNELIKTIRRPRSFIGFAVILFVCVLLQGAFYNDGKEILGFITQQVDTLFDVQGNAINGNLICFIILQSLIVQMPLLVALVTGDLISGETATGSVRFLLSRPAPRWQIVLAKWLAGMFYTSLLLIFLGVLALFGSHLIFGDGDLMYLNSEALTVIRANDMAWRWMGAFGIAFLSLSVVASLSTLLSAILDNSITPIVSVMAIIIIFTIIGMFDLPSFDPIKPFLFTTHMIAWRSFFEDPIPTGDIVFSAGVLLLHIIIFLGVSMYHYQRKDITA